MPRVTKADLERENVHLMEELDEARAELKNARERSRSRQKGHFERAPLSAAGRRALDIVCKHDRDPVIEELRATVARLNREHAEKVAAKDAEIDDLKKGKGQIKPILAATWPSLDGSFTKNQTVSEYLDGLWKKYHNLGGDILFGPDPR